MVFATADAWYVMLFKFVLLAIVVLVSGYLGVPALALLKGHLKLYAMVGEATLVALYIANGKRLKGLK